MHFNGKRALRHVLSALFLILFVLHSAYAADKPALSLEETVGLKTASGAGGHPGTYTSTGITLSIP